MRCKSIVSSMLVGAVVASSFAAGSTSAEAAQTIVGNWRFENEVCSHRVALAYVRPMAFGTEDFTCTFHDVARQGDVVTWKGRCGFGDDGGKPTTVVARSVGSSLFVRIGREAPIRLERCS